jgi:cell division protein FtsZ
MEKNRMIDFKRNGPHGYGSKEGSSIRLRFVGVGQAGINVVDQMVLRHNQQGMVVVLDMDQQTLAASVVREKHLLGRDEVRGLGCYGDRERAEKIAANEIGIIDQVVDGNDYLVICVGCGGGAGAALALGLAKAARVKRCKVLVLATLPYRFEGARRRAQAIEDVRSLRAEADCVLVFANDRLIEAGEAMGDMRHGYHLQAEAMARAAEAVESLLAKRGLIQLGFADVRSLFGRFRGLEALENCWAGYAEMGADASGHDLAAEILDGPVLSDEEVWAKADHAIITLSGGHDLSLSGVQNVLDELQRKFPRQMPVAVNANLEERSEGKLRLTLLLAMTQPEKNPESVPVSDLGHTTGTSVNTKKDTQRMSDRLNPEESDALAPEGVFELEEQNLTGLGATTKGVAGKIKKGKYVAKQEELPLDAASSRGHFDKALETFYNGESLDQPTFRRRRIVVRV